MSQKFIVDPDKIFGLQTEVNKNLKSAFDKQNPDYVNCLVAFHKMSLEKRKEIFGIQNDPWVNQKISISMFYNKVRKILGLSRQKIDWSNTVVPEYSEEFPVLDYVDRSITWAQWVEVYKKLFGIEMVFDNDYSKNIDTKIATQPARPVDSYPYSHKGGTEPDSEHLSDSYAMFSVDGNKYMIPIEGIIFATRYRFETGKTLDIKGETYFHALDFGGYAIRMYVLGNRQFFIDGGNRFRQNSLRGPRQVNF